VIGPGTAAVIILAATSGCAGIGGTANPAASPTAAVASSSAPASSSASSSSSAATTTSSSPTSSAVASSSKAAVLGLPHSAPLAPTVLLVTRIANGTADLYQIDTTTGAVGKKLTNGTPGPQFPILSPDRGSVIYVQTGPETQLRTMAVDGTGDRALFAELPSGCENIYRPAWNPVDGNELALICVNGEGATELHLVNVDGTLRSTLSPGITHIDDVAFSPDGKTLLYWGSADPGAVGGALYIQPIDGSSTPKQVTLPGGANDADATFAPDGKTIVFRRATADLSSSQILAVQSDGTGLVPITDGTAYDQDPSISPDGTQVAFWSTRNNAAGTNDAQIWVINKDGTAPRQLGIGTAATGVGSPAWGPR
jgi:TolB protein